jgi:hemerythrin-like domain-containing protein
MSEQDGRRAFLTVAGAGALLAACRPAAQANAAPPAPDNGGAPSTPGPGQPNEEKSGDVSATEDLMREHGVIRRVLVVYRETAAVLRSKRTSVAPEALWQAAKLIRTFGEDYHERQLEEMHIFPALVKAASPLAGTVRTLIAQHQRGREATEYILTVTRKTIDGSVSEPLARTLDAFARMYEEHAAIEDTIVFPAWKKALTSKELDEMGDRFEGFEHKAFGRDGFEDAVGQVARIERALGIELAALTAPPPPSV